MNSEIEKALKEVHERAKVFLKASNDHAKLVAEGKLKDACGVVDRLERRRKETMKKLASMEEGSTFV